MVSTRPTWTRYTLHPLYYLPLLFSPCTCFLSPPSSRLSVSPLFLWDRLSEAFSNDPTLSSSKNPVAQRSSGAPLSSSLILHSRFVLALHLGGVPERDPSNDLYAARTAITSSYAQGGGSREDWLGVAVPKDPTGRVEVEFQEGGKLKIWGSTLDNDNDKVSLPSSPLCLPNVDGQWTLRPNGRVLCMAIPLLGYRRTVTTVGSILNVFSTSSTNSNSGGEESGKENRSGSSQTRSTYSIPEGLIYAEISVGYGNEPGRWIMMDEKSTGGTGTMIPGGVLRVEKKMGLFGVVSKMVPCGRFSGKMAVEQK